MTRYDIDVGSQRPSSATAASSTSNYTGGVTRSARQQSIQPTNLDPPAMNLREASHWLKTGARGVVSAGKKRLNQAIESLSMNVDNAMLVAAQEGKTKRVSKLIDRGANVNARDPLAGKTALHYAAEGGYIDLATFLASSEALDAKADLISDLPQ